MTVSKTGQRRRMIFVLALLSGLSVPPLTTLAFSSRRSSDGGSSQLETVWIVKADGAQSCAPPHSGTSLDQGSDELHNAKIPVLGSRKGNDGKMHAQMCGAPTGTLNAYQIEKTRLQEAQALGFKLAPAGRE